MKLSAQMVLWISIVFAIVCISYGVFGFSSLDSSMTAQQRDDGRGFAMFFLFLGGFGVVMAVVSWLMIRGKPRRDE